MTRAKMRVATVTKSEYNEVVKLTAICSGSKEDNSFAKATPYGTVELMIDNPEVHGKFIPGKSYFVDFTPAD